MNEFESACHDYINKFVDLNTSEKRREIIIKLQELITVAQKVASDLGESPNLLYDKEVDDLNKEEVSEDDYLEGLLVYICSMEDLVSKIFDKMYS